MMKLNLQVEPGKHDIRMWRDFDAPRELVFKALTDPSLIPQWWGPDYLSIIVDKMEVKKGGIWRYIQRDAEGQEYIFNGVYHEITAPERMIYTFEWEGMPSHVLLETVSLEDHNGKTRLIDSSVFQSIEDRDGMIENGMEEGSAHSWDRLEKLLKTL